MDRRNFAGGFCKKYCFANFWESYAYVQLLTMPICFFDRNQCVTFVPHLWTAIFCRHELSLFFSSYAKKLLVLFLICSFSNVIAQPKKAGKILAFERERVNATLMANAEKLQQMLADEVVWIHSSGKKDDKRTYIQHLAEKKRGTKPCLAKNRRPAFMAILPSRTGFYNLSPSPVTKQSSQ